MRRSLARKLALLVGVTMIVLLGALLIAGHHFWREILRNQIDARLSAVVESRRDMVKAHITQLRQQVALNTTRGEFIGFLIELLEQRDTANNRHWSQVHLSRLVDGDSILSAQLADPAGKVQLAGNSAEAGADLSSIRAFQRGLTESYVAPPTQAGGRFRAVISAPVHRHDEDQRAVGVLLMTVDVTPLAHALGDTTGLGQTGDVLLGMREDGQVRYLFPPRYREQTLAVPLSDDPVMASVTQGHVFLKRARGFQGESVLAAGRPIGYGGWGLVARIDEAEAYAPIALAVRQGLILGGAVALAGLIVAIILARGFVRPVRRLVAGAARIASGQYGTTVPVQGHDELAMLAASFNEMSAAIRNRSAERDATEAALRASEAQLRTIGDGLPSGAIYRYGVRPDGSQFFTHLGAGLERSTGHTLEELRVDAGKAFENILPDDLARLERATRESAAKLAPFDQQFRRRNRVTGEIRWFHSRSMPHRAGDGTVLWDGVEFDVSDRKSDEQALIDARNAAEQARAEAEEANKEKDRFLAVLSHELRTPLTPVVAALSLIERREDLAEETRKYLGMIHRNVDLEVRLIDDLLDVTRIARGKVDLHRKPVDLCEILGRAVEVVRPDLETRQLHFSVSNGEQPLIVDADATRLQQVFWNLLRNAIKFTPRDGCVGIRCHVDEEQAVVEIQDSGVGIEPAALGRIFNLFEQGERTITRQFGGLGLGLAISKTLVELHRGSIEAVSEGKGKGATFRVRLPRALEMPRPSQPHALSTAVQRPLHILLVEDHGDTARAMRHLLMRSGHRVESAGDVATALELAGRHHFDLLISDLGLPDRSGVDLLRELGAMKLQVPAIALSGYGTENDISQSRAAGFIEHLIKPVDPSRLEQAIGRAAGSGGGGEARGRADCHRAETAKEFGSA